VRARGGANVLVDGLAPKALVGRVAGASTVSAEVKVALNVVDVLKRGRWTAAHAPEGVVVVDVEAATDNGEVAPAARERIQYVVAVPANDEVWRSGTYELAVEVTHSHVLLHTTNLPTRPTRTRTM
jgi:hypothetical protein